MAGTITESCLPEECVVQGMRHAFRDRLRAVNASTDMIDQLGGWSTQTGGCKYGDSFSLSRTCAMMESLDFFVLVNLCIETSSVNKIPISRTGAVLLYLLVER